MARLLCMHWEPEPYPVGTGVTASGDAFELPLCIVHLLHKASAE